jgi:hypothetical protein
MDALGSLAGSRQADDCRKIEDKEGQICQLEARIQDRRDAALSASTSAARRFARRS